MRGALAALVLVALVQPAQARDSLGIYADWGAFRDAAAPRCYAIASAPVSTRQDYQGFATVGHWPKRGLRNQVHFRLSRKLAPDKTIRLRIGNDRFDLVGGGGDAWAKDRRMDAAIVAAMRSADTMRIYAVSASGTSFSDGYTLAGAASAIDAAAIGCAKAR